MNHFCFNFSENIKFCIWLLSLILLLNYGCKDSIVNPPAEKEKILFASVADNTIASYISNLFLIDLDGKNLKQLTNSTSYYSTNPKVSYDGLKIIFQSNMDGFPDIFSMNMDGSGLTNLTKNRGYSLSPQLSKKNLIVFERFDFVNGIQQDPQIYKMNIDGSSPVRLTNSNGLGPVLSPDGDKIFYHSYANGGVYLFVMDISGENQKALTDSTILVSSTDNDYKVSHDGSKIAFVAFRSGWEPDLYVMNTNGAGLYNLTNNSEMETHPVFSKDDSQILYSISPTSDSIDKRAVKIISSGGGSPETIIEMKGVSSPIFTTDSDKIIFTADNNGANDIFIVSKDGGNLFNITNSTADDFFPQVLIR